MRPGIIYTSAGALSLTCLPNRLNSKATGNSANAARSALGAAIRVASQEAEAEAPPVMADEVPEADRTPEADLPAANTALCLARQHPERRQQHLREFERLVDGAARRERAKRAAHGRAKRRKHGPTDDADGGGYLSQPLAFSEGRLVDAEGGAVMMGWEDGLMRHHAAALRRRLDDGPASVLNVGFGLGLIDEALQREWRGVPGFRHTIIEAHPDVLRHARSLGWHERTGVSLT